MKTSSLFTLCFFLLNSCGPSGKGISQQVNKYQPNKSVDRTQDGLDRARWSTKNLPVVLHISDSFNQEERKSIQKMSDVWNGAKPKTQREDFLKIEEAPIANMDYSDFKDYENQAMGVYKSKEHFPEEYASALAITKFVGEFHYVNNHPMVEIESVYIVVNNKNYKFNDKLKKMDFDHHDFSTVILHELGHVLGLQHENNSDKSIMRPTLNTRTIQRTPSSDDLRKIQERYLNGDLATSLEASIEEPLDEAEGTRVEWIVPLYP